MERNIDKYSLLNADHIEKILERLKAEREARGDDEEENERTKKTTLLERRRNIGKINEIMTKVEDEMQLISENKPPRLNEEELTQLAQEMSAMPAFTDGRTLSVLVELINKLSQLVKARVRDLTNRAGGQTFNAKAFGKAFKKIGGDMRPGSDGVDREGWIVFGQKLHHLLCYAPKYSTLVHLMSEENRTIVQAPRTQRTQRNTQREARVELKETDKNAGSTSDATLSAYIKHASRTFKEAYTVNGQKPIPFFKFALDSTDFSRSVENVFHLSFILKEGYMKIQLSENKELELVPVGKNERKIAGIDDRTQQETNQMICGFDYSLWKKFIRKYKLESCGPMIPPLEEAVTR
ncbi:hypothetical protein L596_007722 [Steinernema carpocapsae]|uniref:Non-structural maintenance of chromosomes element 4 n=1 Tax=Steinernema carpocapsae TaxID=34508 RepID=A0A4U5PAD7_STECR|nr:hypothetical protein L596_007722 [Steinernema carpocapsae]